MFWIYKRMREKKIKKSQIIWNLLNDYLSLCNRIVITDK